MSEPSCTRSRPQSSTLDRSKYMFKQPLEQRDTLSERFRLYSRIGSAGGRRTVPNTWSVCEVKQKNETNNTSEQIVNNRRVMTDKPTRTSEGDTRHMTSTEARSEDKDTDLHRNEIGQHKR